jgi:hypothetical protein
MLVPDHPTGAAMTEYTTICVETHEQVATVTLQAPEHYRSPTVAVPGDGGMALIPLFMTPVKAKEALMLAAAAR